MARAARVGALIFQTGRGQWSGYVAREDGDTITECGKHKSREELLRDAHKKATSIAGSNRLDYAATELSEEWANIVHLEGPGHLARTAFRAHKK